MQNVCMKCQHLFFSGVSEIQYLLQTHNSPSTSIRKLFYALLYSEEVNLQIFVMIQCKTFCRNYKCTKCFFYLLVFKSSRSFNSYHSKMAATYSEIGSVGKLEAKFQGQVVQSVVSLTSLLRVISLTVLVDSIHNILIFFADKM